MFSQLLHVSEINFCLSLESLALYIPCAAALLSSLNTSPLLLACCLVRVICVHAPAGWVSISLFFPLIEAQLCTQLPPTMSTVQVLGSTRFVNCVLPSICYESKGWSSSKQSVLISSTFLLLMVRAAAAALRCSVYPKLLSDSVFLLPWVHVPDFADVQENISILC